MAEICPHGWCPGDKIARMNGYARVLAVLRGQRPDRPPVSFWHHFRPEQTRGPAAVDAHLLHLRRWDLDFLKVMNDTDFPRPSSGWFVRSAADLAKLPECTGEEPEFAAELEVVRLLADRLAGQVPITVTVFNAWAVLRRLCRPPSEEHGPPTLGLLDDRDGTIAAMLRADRAAVAEALQRIGSALSKFAVACLEAGADGVFLSVRDDWVDTPANGPGTYDELVRPVDLSILSAVRGGRFNVLHVCGQARDFRRFADYPVQAVNWADRYAGPSIAQAAGFLRPAICAGLDNLGTMPTGTPADCAEQVRDALRQAAARSILIAPGCTYDPQAVPQANLEAIAQAVRSASG